MRPGAAGIHRPLPYMGGMSDFAPDSTEEWTLPEPARPPLLAELVERIDEALATARASEAAVMTVGAAALDAADAIAGNAPLAVAAVLVGAFAIFHGHAHGTELPAAADAIAYSVGFVVATGLLHLAGIALGSLTRWPAGKIAVRAAGGAIAVAGVIFLGVLG